METVYRPVVAGFVSLFRLMRVRVTVEGGENVPVEGGCVIAIGHLGYLDFALSGHAAWTSRRRLVRFMAKQEVFDHRVAGPLMRAMSHIPVDRAAGAGAYQHAVKALRAGEVVGVHPEGTISSSFTVETLRTGAARMAAEAGVPLVPMTVWGSQRVMSKGRRPSLRAAFGVPVDVRVGAPLHPTPADDPTEVTAALATALEELTARSAADYADRPGPSDPPAWWMPAHLGGTAPTRAEAEASKTGRR